MKESLTRKRKGFTLVELLIVIVVIGILSAMMMLSSSEAVSSAKATAIISDLRNLKTAVLAYFADHPDDYITKAATADEEIKDDDPEWDEIMSYLNGKDFPNKKSYKLKASGNDNGNVAWYVLCDICSDSNGMFKKNSSEATTVTKKLAGRAKSVGLLANRYKPSETKKPFDGNEGVKTAVYMLVQ